MRIDKSFHAVIKEYCQIVHISTAAVKTVVRLACYDADVPEQRRTRFFPVHAEIQERKCILHETEHQSILPDTCLRTLHGGISSKQRRQQKEVS